MTPPPADGAPAAPGGKMRCEEAATPTEALARLKQAADPGHPSGLVSLDLQMPEMDGLALARAIRREPSGKAAPLILLTSWGQHGAARAAREVRDRRLSPEARPGRPAPGLLDGGPGPAGDRPGPRPRDKRGDRADVVANGQEAVLAFESIPHDLILMDCQMPEMDGFEAARDPPD